MGRKRPASRLITFAGIGAIVAIVGFMVFMQVGAARNNDFKRSFEGIVVEVNALTQQYQAEEKKWTEDMYDNATMISIVEKYLPRYQSLIDRAESMDAPERYTAAQDFLVKALEAEKQSNEHFRNYLATGDEAEYKKSSDLLTTSLVYSTQADAAIKDAG